MTERYLHFNTKAQAERYLRDGSYEEEYYTIKRIKTKQLKVFRVHNINFTGYYIWSWKKLQFLKYDYDIGGKINGG